MGLQQRIDAFLFLFCLFDPSCSKTVSILDTTRVDALDWTDAHHVAYGSPITSGNLPIPPSRSKEFLKEASDEFLCRKNIYGQTALHLTVRQNRLGVVEVFVERKLPCLNKGNMHGDTALHYASAWGMYDSVKLLLSGGADPRIRNDQGKMPVHDAQTRGYNEIVYLLTEAEANRDLDHCKEPAITPQSIW